MAGMGLNEQEEMIGYVIHNSFGRCLAAGWVFGGAGGRYEKMR